MKWFNLNNNIIGAVICIVFCILSVTAWGRIIAGCLHIGVSQTKKVKAVVLNKQTYVTQVFFKKIPSDRKRYVVAFLIDGREKYFSVSPETYDRIKLKQKGTLTYRGSRFYDFD